MRIWTIARVKSCTQHDIIERYNTKYHNILDNHVVRFFVAEVKVENLTVNYCKMQLFVQLDVNTRLEASEMYRLWNQLDPAMYGPYRYTDKSISVVSDDEMAGFIDSVKDNREERIMSLMFGPGDNVEIIDGCFKGVAGVVTQVNGNKVSLQTTQGFTTAIIVPKAVLRKQ
jgi:transcription antitermination factor NusG